MPSHSYESDHALVAACIAGDPEAWRVFEQQFGRLIAATAAKIRVRPGAAAHEDVVGHVYEKLLEDDARRLRAWRGQARLSTYLVQVVRNLALDYAARMGRGPQPAPLEAGPEPAAPAAAETAAESEARAEQVAAMHAAMAQLPERQAVIVRMRLEGASLREIAALLGRPVGTVSVENSRALERLRQAMETILGGSSGWDAKR